MFNCGKEIDTRKGSGKVEIVNEAEEKNVYLLGCRLILLTKTKNSFHIFI